MPPEEPAKPGMAVEFELSEEQWCALRVTDDGTMIYVKPVIVGVRRLDQNDAQGKPIYEIAASIAARVVCPQEAIEMPKKKTKAPRAKGKK